MLATLYITGQTLSLHDIASILKFNLNSPDVWSVPDTPSITIDSVRQIKDYLKTGPLSLQYKTVLFDRAQRLTLPAQNALLKTLEEPPAYANLVLVCDHRDQVLSTIQSRCQIKFISSTPTPSPNSSDQIDIDNLLQSLESSNQGARLSLTTPYSKTKESALNFLKHVTAHISHQNYLHPSHHQAIKLARLQSAYEHLLANANPQLTLDNLFLHW